MRELKILAVVAFFTAVVYWGVEPFAHSQMHPHVAPADFAFKDLGATEKKGDAAKGAETFLSAGCIGCHGVAVANMPAPMDNASASATFGVTPPDLSSAGAIYDKNYLAALIKDPTKALKVEHKFNETRPHPMIQFFGLGGDLDQEVADIVAYLQSIAPTTLDDKKVYADACQRCHDMKYDKLMSTTDKTALMAYMGTLPPDLSIMIRSKGRDYLTTFINNPQKQLAGTSMPRVGLSEKAQNQVVAYMEKVGDRKKAEREDLGYKLIGYMVLFTLLAYAWKVKIWKEVH
ncbi:c-type cytochrome [Sulfurospirillum arsenophilum]|uniref:c-type cytochrome n=1 Tax=Sulfurospirillum arsenophilum TaxID=56698 RepID=UPI0005A5F1E8|nr:c-type cytochrome [Sulfurospirillum arsenophilum]